MLTYRTIFSACLSLSAMLLATEIPAQTASDLAPEIIFLGGQQGNGSTISGMSNSGLLVISGSTIYDFSTTPYSTFTLSGGTPRDITDDATTAVGTAGGGPAVWKKGEGWKSLPVPSGKRGGRASKVTPDGHYAVGSVGNDGCMWDLTTMSIVELPNRPLIDRRGPYNDPNNFENFYQNISPDGRYVQGILSWSYVGDQTAYVYDRETDETHYIGFKKNEDGSFTPDDPAIHYTECEEMSADGHYLTGPVYLLHGSEYLGAYIYDVWNDKIEYFNEVGQDDAYGFCVTNDGMVFLRRPAQNPYNDGYVCIDNFFYSFADIYDLGYGMDIMKYGIENTGTPIMCSSDGKTLAFYSRESGYYLVRFKENLRDVCNRLELLHDWNVTPRDGSVMSHFSKIAIEFSYPVEADASAYSKIVLTDEDGNVLGNPVSTGGVTAERNKLNIVFRSRMLDEGKKYFVTIPEGVCHVKGLPQNKNKQIRVGYTGRGDYPVEVTDIFPEPGSELSSLSLQNDPILISFDADIMLNPDLAEPLAIYVDDSERPASYLNVGQYSENMIAIFPSYELNLYKGGHYTVKVPESVVTDISGFNPSSPFEIKYEGVFTPQLGDEKYLFKSDCSNFDNFLFYEGDYGTPVAEYAQMGFTYDTTPWWVVRDNEESVDMAYASHSCYTDGRQSNDWVTTRQIFIPDETAYLAFDGQSYRRSKNDILKIYVYEYDGILNSLNSEMVERMQNDGDLIFEEKLDPGATEGGIDGEWTHYVLPLDKYAGKNVYICFVNQNCNQSLVMIDNVEVGRSVDSFISLTNGVNIIAQDDLEIKGFLTIENQLADYKSVAMTLKDSEGHEVSKIKDENVSLKAGDAYQFTFPDKLPLKLGEENKFDIEFSLDDNSGIYKGMVRNLTFEPVKRVVMEEFTGRDCQFCPLGLSMIQRLETMFPNNFIPVSLFCYMGTDPKGLNVMNYWNYLGLSAAPSARINRGGTSMPLYASEQLGRYAYTNSDLPQGENGILWYDDVVNELAEPAYIDVIVTPTGNSETRLAFQAEFRSAVNLEDQNLRVFGVLLENNILDYQVNGVYTISDPLLGDWGAGGKYSSGIVQATFDHAAKATWGTSYEGTPNLLPRSLSHEEKYTVDITVPVPADVASIDNCEFVVILIDGKTGRILNAAISEASSAVKGIVDDSTPGISLRIENGALQVSGVGRSEVAVYSPAGILVARGSGDDSYGIDLGSYKGIAIIKATNAGGVTITRKIMVD